MSDASATFAVAAGALIRGDVRRELKAEAVAAGVTVQIDEDKGWLESLFIVKVRGERTRVVAFVAAACPYLEIESA